MVFPVTITDPVVAVISPAEVMTTVVEFNPTLPVFLDRIGPVTFKDPTPLLRERSIERV
jgi:hypothetical protein